MQNMIT